MKACSFSSNHANRKILNNVKSKNVVKYLFIILYYFKI